MYVTVYMVIMVYVLYAAMYVTSTNLCIGFYTCRWHKNRTRNRVDHENAPGMIFLHIKLLLHR